MDNEKPFAAVVLDETITKLSHGNTNERACALILEYGDAARELGQYRDWLLDQLLRVLAGESYRLLTMTYEQGTGNDWETGIAP